MTRNVDGKDYEPLGGFAILISAASVEQTGLEPSVEYEFVATFACVCRWDTTDAAPADGGFTFAVPANYPLRVVCPAGNTLLNVEEASADAPGGAVLLISKVLPR